MTFAIAAIAVSIALPLFTFRGRTLRHYFAADVASWLVAAVLWRLHLQFEPWTLAVAFATLKLALFAAVVARGDEVRWSANRAALIALAVYGLVIGAMLRLPIDGDEPYYLLVTESLARDGDFDLRNQYADLAHSATRRTDLVPQQGDPVGKHGEQYSRHEPFLPLVMVPGYLVAGLPGAVATIAIFGALLVRSTIRMFEDETIDDRTTRLVFPFVAFAPPLLYYATRIWPEVPAAWCFVEAVRGIAQRRAKRWIPSTLALVLLKLRFGLVGFMLVVRARRQPLLILLLIPLVIVWAVSGSATNVHSWRELLPGHPSWYFHGLFGLALDGMSGLLFQAPFYLLGILALARWRSMPESFRIGMTGSALYIIQLIPRAEWHGGWSPPLRYITFLMPVLALGAAALIERSAAARAWLGVAAAGSIALVVHALAFPWRLFHIANGEAPAGEALSRMYGSDFSRLFPSFIRMNDAAWIFSIALVVLMLLVASRRVCFAPQLVAPCIALALAIGFAHGRKPGDRIDFEDVHVTHAGGEMWPQEYTISRFLYRGGWIVKQGDSMSFLARRGPARLDYSAPQSAMIELGGHAYALPATGADRYASIRVTIPANGRVTLRCLAGIANLDRVTHE